MASIFLMVTLVAASKQWWCLYHHYHYDYHHYHHHHHHHHVHHHHHHHVHHHHHHHVHHHHHHHVHHHHHHHHQLAWSMSFAITCFQTSQSFVVEITDFGVAMFIHAARLSIILLSLSLCLPLPCFPSTFPLVIGFSKSSALITWSMDVFCRFLTLLTNNLVYPDLSIPSIIVFSLLSVALLTLPV